MDLLFFFVFPVATILLSVVWQKIVKCPILVAITTFAIFLIVTYTAYDSSFLIYTIVYTILSYITACIIKLTYELIKKNGLRNINEENINENTANTNSLTSNANTLNTENDNSNDNCGTNNDITCYYNRYGRNLQRKWYK